MIPSDGDTVSEQKQFTPEQVHTIVNQIMVDEFEVDPGDLDAAAPLPDLGLDSLDGVDLVVAIEKAFGLRIPEQEARSIRTLGDIYQRVLSRLEELKEAV